MFSNKCSPKCSLNSAWDATMAPLTSPRARRPRMRQHAAYHGPGKHVGTCSKLLSSKICTTDGSVLPITLPKTKTKISGVMVRKPAICEMNIDGVMKIQKHHGRSYEKFKNIMPIKNWNAVNPSAGFIEPELFADGLKGTSPKKESYSVSGREPQSAIHRKQVSLIPNFVCWSQKHFASHRW